MGIFELAPKKTMAGGGQGYLDLNYIAGPIATLQKRFATTITTFVHRQGEWFFGPETPADFDLVSRSFLRAGPPERTVDYFRYEISIIQKDARLYGLSSRHRLVIADMPLGQRRFQTARLQNHAQRVHSAVFEELLDTYAPERSAQCAALTDMQAIGVLHRLPVNVFSQRPALTAAIAGTEAGSFVGYNDLEPEFLKDGPFEIEGQAAARRIRQELTARDRSDGCYAFGVVSDLDTIRNDLWLHPKLRQVLEAIGRGDYQIPLRGRKMFIKVPLQVAARSIDHFNIAVFQSMAGAGRQAAAWFDRPVVDHVLYLFHEHLLAAIDRLEDRLIPPGAIEGDIPDMPHRPDGHEH